MYDAMINTFLLTEKGAKLPDDLKKLFADRIVSACNQQYGCGAEKEAALLYTAIAKSLEQK
jgi:hypothetical protein